MLDRHLRPLIDPPLDRLAQRLARAGITADQVTLVGFALGCLSFPALAAGAYGWALVAILLNRLCDGVDGAVARARGLTDFGGYLDIVLDFILYAGVVFFFALGRPEAWGFAAFLLFSFMGTASSFLAFAILAAKHRLSDRARGVKSFYYLGGLAEGTETIACMLLLCLFPGAYAWIMGIYGALCWMTTAGRILAARATFKGSDKSPETAG